MSLPECNKSLLAKATEAFLGLEQEAKSPLEMRRMLWQFIEVLKERGEEYNQMVWHWGEYKGDDKWDEMTWPGELSWPKGNCECSE